jgi:hypothetical protein
MDSQFVTIRDIKFKCDEDGSVYVPGRSDWKKVGGKHSQGYLGYNSPKGLLKLHRIIASAFLGLDFENKKTEVDHIDGDRSNNKVTNLRIVTHMDNCKNYQKKEVKGLYKVDYGWRGQINHNGKQISKRFKTQEEAIEWRKAKEIEFGYSHTTLYEQG